MRDISASVQFIGGTTELMITPPIAETSSPAIVKRLRVRTPYSSTVWTRAVVRRQFAISSSSRKTPRTVFVLPTSTVSSIRSLPPGYQIVICFRYRVSWLGPRPRDPELRHLRLRSQILRALLVGHAKIL